MHADLVVGKERFTGARQGWYALHDLGCDASPPPPASCFLNAVSIDQGASLYRALHWLGNSIKME